MSRVKSEYEVEAIFIDQLESIGYQYFDMANYDDVVANFRSQFCKVNDKVIMAGKGSAELSDSEFEKVMLRLENHTIYESAKILREKWVLELDNGNTIYVQFLTDDMNRNTYQVTHQVTMDKTHKEDVEYKNRYDVTVLINGLPLVISAIIREKFDYTKWQQQRFDNMSSDEFQQAAISYAKENPFSMKE